MLHLRRADRACASEERRSRSCALWFTAVLAAAYLVGTCASAARAQTAFGVPSSYLWALRFAQHPPARPIAGAGLLERDRWPEKVLYAFNGPDGYGPNPLIKGKRGVLYGTTYAGGASGSACFGGGCGTVFQLTPPSPSQPTWTETVLYSFLGGADGSDPSARLTLGPHGVLYGTTYTGGASGSACYGGGCGTIFALTPPPQGQTNWSESVLYSFMGGADGGFPFSYLTDLGGSLYGTTTGFGALNGGTAFRLSPPKPGQTGWTETVIHTFGGPGDGKYPSAGFAVAGDTLLSTTGSGGLTNCPGGGCGTVFQLTPKGPGNREWRETILHYFNGFDGWSPFWEPTLDPSGAIYATTSGGGAGGCGQPFGCGTAIKLTPPLGQRRTWDSRVIFYFSPQTGYFPGTLTPDGFGNVYGEASSGAGVLADGLILRLSPHGNGQWAESVLHVFNGADGIGPNGELTVGSNGRLYGTAYSGGNSCACGVVFELMPSGSAGSYRSRHFVISPSSPQR